MIVELVICYQQIYVQFLNYLVLKILVNLHQLKKQFLDASHICYGYRIKEGLRLDEFYTDAGEPKGSSGLPILNVLKRNKIVDAVIFVVRYFGGSKLGISGLINAYGTAAKETMQNADLKQWVQLERISFNYNYDLHNQVNLILQKFNVNEIKSDFGEYIKVELEIDVKRNEELRQSLKEVSNGTIRVIQVA